MSTTVRVRACFVARWAETIEVSIPDGTTADQLDRVISDAIDDHPAEPDGHDIECDSYDIVGERPNLPPLDLSWVEPAMWGDYHGRAVWSDGACVVFRDGPRPDSLSDDPYVHGRGNLLSEGGPVGVVAAIDRILSALTDEPHTGMFHPRFAPMLAAGSVRRCPDGSVDVAVVCGPDGTILAIVMPLRSPVPGHVDASGRPL